MHAFGHDGSSFLIYSPLGLSLPRDDDFISLLVSFSTRLANKYLITTVIQDRYSLFSGSVILYNIAKPFVWHRNKGAGSVVEGR